MNWLFIWFLFSFLFYIIGLLHRIASNQVAAARRDYENTTTICKALAIQTSHLTGRNK